MLAFNHQTNTYFTETNIDDKENNETDCHLLDQLLEVQPNHWTLLKNFACLQPVPLEQVVEQDRALLPTSTADNWEYQNVRLAREDNSTCDSMSSTLVSIADKQFSCYANCNPSSLYI